MRRIISIGLSTLTTLSALYAFSTPAKADLGDLLLGIGATAGVSAIINNNQENRYRPVPPKEEYYRGVQDGVNGNKYDNPRNSSDYDTGYEEGLQRRKA